MDIIISAAKSLQSCPTLCNPTDGSLPGSPIPGILQARTVEWVAISFSNAWKWKLKVKWLSRVQLLATPWTAAYPAPPPMEFSRQEYWNGVSLPSPDSRYIYISFLHLSISWIELFYKFYVYTCCVVFIFAPKTSTKLVLLVRTYNISQSKKYI